MRCVYRRSEHSGISCQRFLSTRKHSTYLSLAPYSRAESRRLRTRRFQTATFLNARRFKVPVCFHGTSSENVYILHETDSQFRCSGLIYLVRTSLLRSVHFLQICSGILQYVTFTSFNIYYRICCIHERSGDSAHSAGV